MDRRDGALYQLQSFIHLVYSGRNGELETLGGGNLAIFIEDLDSRANLQVQVELLRKQAN